MITGTLYIGKGILILDIETGSNPSFELTAGDFEINHACELDPADAAKLINFVRTKRPTLKPRYDYQQHNERRRSLR